MKRRVVITGMGAIGPNGHDVAEIWRNVAGGISGIGSLTLVNAAPFASRIAGEVRNFDFSCYFSKRDLLRLDRYVQLCLVAYREAAIQAGWDELPPPPERTGVYVGSGGGGISSLEQNYEKFLAGDDRHISSTLVPMVITNMAAGEIAIRHGHSGPNFAPVSACATGNHSIGLGFRAIQHGEAEAMVVGAADALITNSFMSGFTRMRALSTRNDDPAGASRPFDAERDGFVLSEGASVLLLEGLEQAQDMGRPILAEVVGFGMTSDAYHMTSPAPDGAVAGRAITAALVDAGIEPSAVDYINAHGTSTPMNDKTEVKAIRSAFGKAAERVAISSTKSTTGHLLGAASALEAVLCVSALQNQFIPPTINLQNPDPECDLDFTPNIGIKANLEYVASNAFGFGGHNAVLVLRRYTG
ncbi:beta-ketoacyl-ACP synthase II [Methylocucumis oryzae]|uniref:3-oxoacyl-[acyl-carrier-protein] synthase 2 n=1 Tax=Methylocucumis oryzae TaxID=1632867 RepID=A0A0F3IF08_9GAMM|nr:beta-ketoacyl-ACP synthase II [Methylocucumis oryzae]KJV05341.1 3-oxoacyl-ACP synthase [Methylocucumis oryzae]